MCALGEKLFIMITSTSIMFLPILTRAAWSLICHSASNLCPTPCCHVGTRKTEPLAHANKALIDVQLNVGTQNMEDLVNTLPFNIGIESLAGLVSSVWQWRLLLVGERGKKTALSQHRRWVLSKWKKKTPLYFTMPAKQLFLTLKI